MDDAKARWEATPEGPSTGTPFLALVDPTILEFKPLPERVWIVQDWLAIGHVTLNYADGGTGKTLLAQQLMTSCATSTPWLGLAVERCPSLGIFCEDDNDELHRRQNVINAYAGISYSALGAMRWQSRVGMDNLLVSFASNGALQITDLLGHIEEAAQHHGARLVVLDTAADMFGGNENDRRQVRQFIGALTGMAVRLQAAVLLNAHPSRAGLNSGELDGGSTAWSNSARSRWSLARPAGEDGEQADPDARILTRRKSNYSSIGDVIRLRWERGVLVPLEAPGGFSGAVQKQAVEELFMTLLDRCMAQGMNLSNSKNATNNAPSEFAKRPDAQGYARREFDAAMSRLFADKRLILETYGRKGDVRQRLARAPETAE